MDELLQIFVEEYFSEDFQQEVNRSFGLFDHFEHNQAYDGMVGIIMNESNLGGDAMRDMFVDELNVQLNFVLEQHMIQLVDIATIYEKNEVLLALAHVQDLEDYTGIIRTLETLESPESQFARVIAELSMLDEGKVMEILKELNPRVLQILKDYIYKKEEAREVVETVDPKQLKQLRFFAQVLGTDTLGGRLVAGGLRVGERFETYLDLIQDMVVAADEQTTGTNILSVIYLSVDGLNSPLLVFRKYSYRLLQDIDKVSRVETVILNLIAKLNEHQKAEDEKARQSQTNVTVNPQLGSVKDDRPA